MENIVNGIYVELDCLMDTRLSIMYDIDKNVIENMIKDGSYFNRLEDQFGYISTRLFRTIYKLRNSNILDNPSPTEIVNLVSNYCLEANQTRKSLNDATPVTVYLNVYPYNLTEENLELIRMGLNNSIKVETNIEILNKHYTEIEPLFIYDNIGFMIMYDALTWIEYCVQNKSLLNCSLPDTVLLTPALIHKRMLINRNEMPKFFEEVEKNIEPLIKLIYIDSKMVSFINN